jgi:myo-inositol 2-dehydrogenase / D-chiro-inositol 1-dehydrogenase
MSGHMTSAPPLRIAVLGVGRIGKLHADLIHSMTEASVAMVQDVHEPSAAATGAALGVRHTTSIDEVLASSEVDAVAICSPTPAHVPMLEAAAAAGKAIFCEKPVSLDLALVDAALAKVAAAGVPLHIGFNRRFDPAHRSVRQAVLDGHVGDVEICRITSRDPAPPPVDYVKTSGGLFLDMTIHDFDMARFITGSEVTEVSAHGAVLVDPAIGQAGDIDTAVVVLRHENGAITTIDNTRRAAYGYDQRVEVHGSLGMAQSDNPPNYTGRIHTADGSRTPPIPYFFLERYTPAYVHQWKSFVHAVRTGTPTEITAADGRAPLVIGLAAIKSMRERRTVLTSEITAG